MSESYRDELRELDTESFVKQIVHSFKEGTPQALKDELLHRITGPDGFLGGEQTR